MVDDRAVDRFDPVVLCGEVKFQKAIGTVDIRQRDAFVTSSPRVRAQLIRCGEADTYAIGRVYVEVGKSRNGTVRHKHVLVWPGAA